MSIQEIEDLYIQSLDKLTSEKEKALLLNALQRNPGLATELSQYRKIREIILAKEPASFGPYFTKKVVAKIQNVGIQIDRQILTFFKKYQLAAVGVVVALLALNAVFADQLNWQSLLGLENTNPPTEEIVSFDFNELLNN